MMVKVKINATSISIGGAYGEEITSFIGTIVNEEVGIGADSVFTANITSITNEEIAFTLLLDGEAKLGNYRVLLLLPEGVSNVSGLYRVGESNVELDYSISGNYIVFSASELGDFVMVAGEKWSVVPSSIAWWGWLLISLAIALVVSGASVGIIIAYKKGKLPIDKLKKLFIIKKKETETAEVVAENGEQHEEE